MLKKGLSLALLSSLSISLIGCEQVMDLTEEETSLIAEYAADALLKCDTGYTDRLEEGTKTTAERISTQSVSTETITEEATDSVAQSNETKNQNHQTSSETDIAKLAGVEGASITCRDYVIVSQYPENASEDEPVSVDASEDSRLLVVRFDVDSADGQSHDISLMDKEMEYTLLCNDQSFSPMLTLLMEDLETLETTVSQGKDEEAVLIFEIPDSMEDSIKGLQLKVTQGNTYSIITIL